MSRLFEKTLLREWPLWCVFGCVFFMLYPLLHADLAMIDDWAIVSLLGSKNEVKLPEIFSSIQQEAVERNGRFRPACIACWYLEALFAGDNASIWHTSRLLLAMISALALYLAARGFLPPLQAGVVTLVGFSGPQNESWTRLGACEAYGLPLVLIGVAWIVIELRNYKWHPAQLFPGVCLLLLAGFMKESFIPVLPGVLVFIYVILPYLVPSVFSDHARLSTLDKVILLFLVSGIGAQVLMTMKALSTYGHFNSAQLSPISFLYTVNSMLEIYSKNTLWFVPVAVALMTLPRNPVEPREHGMCLGLIKSVVLLVAGGLLILAPQGLLYAGSFIEGRYLTPGNLFAVFAAALGLYLLSGNLSDNGRWELRGLVCGMLITLALVRFVGTHRESSAEALATHMFQAKVAEIVQVKERHPKLPLLFYSANALDREPVISVATYVSAKLANPEKPFLNPFNWETTANSAMKMRLAKLMTAESLQGDKYFAKISDFPGSAGRCIAVVFSDVNDNPPCEYSVRITESTNF